MTTTTTTATAPLTFTPGQEVVWTSTIPGLGIEIDTIAVVTEVFHGDVFLGDYMWLLPWGQGQLVVSYLDTVPGDRCYVPAGALRLTGRTFDMETLEKIKTDARDR